MFIFAHLGFTFLFILLLTRYLKVDEIDFRFVFVGALLPDILDKTLGYLTPIGGRSLFHGLIPILLLLGIIYYKNELIFLILLITSFFHLILDQMFFKAKVLFWPILGFEVNLGVVEVNNYVYTLFHSTYVQVTELLGLLLLFIIFLNYELYKSDRIIGLLKRGKLGGKQIVQR